MSETATPIEPVNATSTNVDVTPEPVAEKKASPKKASKAQRAVTPMESRFEDVIGEINAKYGGDKNEFRSVSEIVEDVEKASKLEDEKKQGEKLEKENPPQETREEIRQKVQRSEKEGEPTSRLKEKLKVGQEEFELDPEQIKRFAQKGIYYEKKGVEAAKQQKALEQKAEALSQKEAQIESFLKAVTQNPGELLEQILGEQAFEKIKPWAVSKVQKEMQFEENPHLRAVEEAQLRAQKAQAELENFKKSQQEKLVSEQSAKIAENFQKTILDALNEQGIPRTDFTAAEMAAHMARALDRNYEYTPQQLAQIVREDNTVRIRALSDTIVNQIETARKNNDLDSVIKCGEKAVELFGEPLMYAIAKYHLAKMQRGSPQQPKQVLETPKTLKEDLKNSWGKNGRQYMSEDEYSDMRRKIARGEIEPPPGW